MCTMYCNTDSLFHCDNLSAPRLGLSQFRILYFLQKYDILEILIFCRLQTYYFHIHLEIEWTMFTILKNVWIFL